MKDTGKGEVLPLRAPVGRTEARKNLRLSAKVSQNRNLHGWRTVGEAGAKACSMAEKDQQDLPEKGSSGKSTIIEVGR